MTKIVGGVFGLDLTTETSTTPPYTANASVHLVNGRSAIRLAVDRLSPDTVWLPSYLCTSIVDAIRDLDSTIRFYPVSYELEAGARSWLDDLEENHLVLVIDYFGFPFDRNVCTEVRHRGAWLMLDACQALYSVPKPDFADFAVYSPRKFVGVPDGGVLSIVSARAEAAEFQEAALDHSPADWWFDSLRSLMLRREFDLRGGDRSWYELFGRCEENAPAGYYAISDFSQAVLDRSVNYRADAQARRTNFKYLADKLRAVALYKQLPEAVVPLGFPVRTADRDRVRQGLFGDSIYPPVHWPLGAYVPDEFAESHRLEADIMTIPCDQRYGREDMERVVASVEKLMDEG